MKRLSPVCAIALCIGLLATRAVADNSQAADGHGQDRAAITKAVQNYMDVWNGHDIDAVLKTYTEDCDFVNNFGTLYHGRDKMREIFSPMLSGVYSATHQSGSVRTIRFLTPEFAAVDVDWEMTGAKNADGTTRPTRKGIHSLIMAKQKDGSWLIEIMHVHEFTNTPPITPQPKN